MNLSKIHKKVFVVLAIIASLALLISGLLPFLLAFR